MPPLLRVAHSLADTAQTLESHDKRLLLEESASHPCCSQSSSFLLAANLSAGIRRTVAASSRRQIGSFLSFEPSPATPAGTLTSACTNAAGEPSLAVSLKLRAPSTSSTSFAVCTTPTNPLEAPLLRFNMKRYGRKWFGFNGIPCRSDEEESCNVVHATCARVLKVKTVKNMVHKPPFKKPGFPCDPLSPDIDGEVGPAPGESKATNLVGKLKSAVKTVKSFVGDLLDAGATPESKCNARMFDMPWGMFNNQVDNIKGKNVFKVLSLNPEPPLDARLSESVWGMAVHGKTGTWAFDSHGPKAASYLYQLPQGHGAPADYYICDDRNLPHSCALIGGNMRRVCAEYYDPFQCSECEDAGRFLKCEVRGWNDWYKMWSKVPIYPRDIMGELYRDEWKDVMGRPMYASVVIRKRDLIKPVKKIPDNLIQPKGPAAKALAAEARVPVAADMAAMNPANPVQMPGPAPPPGPLAGVGHAISSLLQTDEKCFVGRSSPHNGRMQFLHQHGSL